LPQSLKRRRSLSQRKVPRLYAIVDAEVCAAAGRAPLDVSRAFLSAGVQWIQLRCKSMASGPFFDLAQAMNEDARRAGATLIVNDRADIAALSGAAGLHVGQTDLSPVDSRTVIGAAAILGLSTHTREQWDAAVREPISYLAIGPVFGTGTKDTGFAAVGLETVSQAAAAAAVANLPAVAIGGITIATAKSVIDAGASSVAVISDLLRGDPESCCREFLQALQ
jgi:thiamine-phosphate pyrophosphorylase